MIFSQLKIGDIVYIIEVIGTFKKNMEYSVGSVTSVSNIYDEPTPQQQFPMPNQMRKRVVDINIQSNGETKKFTVPEDRSTITDSQLGLTISTNKEEIASIIRNQYNIYKTRKESIAKCDEEMEKCRAILDKLNVREAPKEDNTIKEMQEQIKQLKQMMEQQKKQPSMQTIQTPTIPQQYASQQIQQANQ